MSKLENALVWLYVKTWGKFGEHVIQQKELWNFGVDDLETIIMTLALPRERQKTERFQALTNSIMEKFEQDCMAFYEWAAKIHKEAIVTLPETVEFDSADEQTTTSQNRPSVKILEWDSGKYLKLFNEYRSI